MTNQIKWTIDPAHSEIGFKARHLMIANTKGTFTKFEANIYTTGKDFETAEVDVWIDASSIITGDNKRDEHLKSADFFDVQNHKQITFRSSTLGKADANGIIELWGELTMIGITKTINLNIESGGIVVDPMGKEKAGFSISGKIKRSDWGLVWNAALETGGFLVGDEITISCEVELMNEGEKDLTMELESSTDLKNMKVITQE